MEASTAANSDTLLTPEQVASYLGVTENRLAKWRVSGRGPAFLKIGGRRIMYRLNTLNAWLEQSEYRSTSEVPEPQLAGAA